MEGKFEFQFRTEVENKLNLGLEIEFGLNLKVSEGFKRFQNVPKPSKM